MMVIVTMTVFKIEFVKYCEQINIQVHLYKELLARNQNIFPKDKRHLCQTLLFISPGSTNTCTMFIKSHVVLCRVTTLLLDQRNEVSHGNKCALYNVKHWNIVHLIVYILLRRTCLMRICNISIAYLPTAGAMYVESLKLPPVYWRSLL